MAERKKSRCRWILENRRANMVVGVLFLIVAGMAALFFLTNDKKPLAVSAPVVAIYEEYNVAEMNPLTENLDEEVTEAVTKYYERQKENSDYVEAYGNLSVFMKRGKYQDTYVVFAKYDMKIKDIYTAVPGLGTLFVDKDAKGKIRVNAKAEDVETQKCIADVTAHEDVQALFQNVETAYARAVKSDAMLAEALNDLQNAMAE